MSSNYDGQDKPETNQDQRGDAQRCSCRSISIHQEGQMTNQWVETRLAETESIAEEKRLQLTTQGRGKQIPAS
jgi:hypothetical protein